MRDTALTSASGLSLPADSYIYRFAPVDAALAAISSDNSLRVFDAETLQLVPGGVFDNVHNGVTCLKTTGAEPKMLFTAGRDGFIRCWDLRIGKKAWEIRDGPAAPFLSIAITSASPTIAAGTELVQSQATVQIWDYRSSTDPVVRYEDCHNDDVTELSYHPSQPSCLLSGSTDGLVNIYNTAAPDEDEGLVEVFNHGSSVSHAGFLTESAVYASSHDETLSIYQRDVQGEEGNNLSSVAFGDMRVRLGCEYVVDVLLSGGDAMVGVGSHSASKLELIPLRLTSQWELNEADTYSLPGAHGEDIVRAIHIDNTTNMVYTGGEDGMVKAWKPTVASGASSHIGPSRHKRNRGVTGGKHHRPY